MARVTITIEDHPTHPGKFLWKADPTIQSMFEGRQLGVMKLTVAQESALFVINALILRSKLLGKGRKANSSLIIGE